MSGRVVVAGCFLALAMHGADARADDPEASTLRDMGLRELARLAPDPVPVPHAALDAPVPEPDPASATATPDPDPEPVGRLRKVVRWVRARLWR
jgi:hypothetical protein